MGCSHETVEVPFPSACVDPPALILYLSNVQLCAEANYHATRIAVRRDDTVADADADRMRDFDACEAKQMDDSEPFFDEFDLLPKGHMRFRRRVRAREAAIKAVAEGESVSIPVYALAYDFIYTGTSLFFIGAAPLVSRGLPVSPILSTEEFLGLRMDWCARSEEAYASSLQIVRDREGRLASCFSFTDYNARIHRFMRPPKELELASSAPGVGAASGNAVEAI